MDKLKDMAGKATGGGGGGEKKAEEGGQQQDYVDKGMIMCLFYLTRHSILLAIWYLGHLECICMDEKRGTGNDDDSFVPCYLPVP